MNRAALPILLLFTGLTQLHADEEADRMALRQLKTAYEEALNTGDLGKITPFLSPGFSGVMVTGEQVRGLPELEAYWKKIRAMIGDGGGYTVKVTTGEVLFSGDLAFCTGTAEELVRSQGQEFPYTSAWTIVCRRDGARWKLERLQATMDPVNNVFVRARVRGVRIQYGAAGFVIGGFTALLILVGLRRAKAGRR